MLDQVGDSPSHDNAAYYQLVVTASVKKLPCVGKLLSVAYECEKCGAVGGFSATKMIGEFDQSDLNECDFQTYHGFRDDTGRQYIHKVEHLIISSRILQEFAKAGFTGIDKYASEPMIYRAIVIRDQ
ncbi:MAG: hypothetical protein DHS20C16_24280 [Phycisphaerae bacterium]|nr:MAG: hypothetical protein DHS20C16_24280 [Phycisphaerae bacterium]